MYAHTLYVVYTTADNLQTKPNKVGWATQFAHFLEKALAEVSDLSVQVVSLSLEESATHTLEQDAWYIHLLSPAYIEALNKTEDPFRRATHSLLTLHFFKAIKYPVPLAQQPAWLHVPTSYTFYTHDTISQSLYEVHDFFSPEAEHIFWPNLMDLTYDVLRAVSDKATSVYLAHTSPELAAKRDTVRRELKRHGYRVLPTHDVPLESYELVTQMRHDLSACVFSIHLIDTQHYGQVLHDKPTTSLVAFQNEVAADYAHEQLNMGLAFKRYVWLSPETASPDEQQRFYLEKLHREPSLQYGAEFLQNPLEDFKTVVLNELHRIGYTAQNEDVNKQAEFEESQKKSIYLIVDMRDEQASTPLREWLETQNFSVLTSSPRTDTLKNLRKTHQHNLTHCDGLIIFFSKATEAWLIAKLQDILKSPGMGRTVPLHNKAIFTDTEANAQRLEEIRVRNAHYRDALVILNKGEFSPRSLEGFVKSLSPTPNTSPSSLNN